MCALPLDGAGHECKLVSGLFKKSETQSRNGQFWKIARKSIMWYSRLCPAEEVSMKRPKLSSGGCKKGGLIAENRFFAAFLGDSGRRTGSGHAWPRLSALFCTFSREPWRSSTFWRHVLSCVLKRYVSRFTFWGC